MIRLLRALFGAAVLLGAGVVAAATSYLTGSMQDGRLSASATLLNSGKVLVAGGQGSGSVLASAELFDPATGTWTPAQAMGTPRLNHSATLLTSGRVLVCGGYDGTHYLASCTRYDPATNTWSAAGSLTAARIRHTATLLASGKVLVAGGYDGSVQLTDARVYDPAANSWTATAPLAQSRTGHVAVALASGNVLVAGGVGDDGAGHSGLLSSSEIYAVADAGWIPAADLKTARAYGTATLLRDGDVLLAGGNGGLTSGVDASGYVFATEVYDAGLDTWTAVGSLSGGRSTHSATLLASGRVLVAGGEHNGGLDSAESYDPVAKQWSAAGSMQHRRIGHQAVMLPSGSVLLIGGYNTESGYDHTTEIYDPAAGLGAWSAAGTLSSPRHSPTLTLLPNGKVLLAGGSDFVTATQTYDAAANQWAASGALAQPRRGHTATLLHSGKVLVAGGFVVQDDVTSYVASAELYDPATNSWTGAGVLATARAFHTATLLPNGKVLVANGNNAAALASCELYDPATNQWTGAASSFGSLTNRTATLLPNGMVLVFAGDQGVAYANSSELYDPSHDSWSIRDDTSNAATHHTATLLPSGLVIAIDGGIDGSANAIAQVYDMDSGNWSVAEYPAIARYGHTATLLTSGKVLIAAGQDAAPLASAQVFTALVGNLYGDPYLGAWYSTGALGEARIGHRSLRLPSGRVLTAGGASLNAERYDPGLDWNDAARPLLAAPLSVVLLPGALQLSGTGFRGTTQLPAGAAGGSEGSGGNTLSAAANVPVVLLQRIDNEQQFVPLADPAQPWSDTSFTSRRIEPFDPYHQRGLIDGPWRVAVIVNGVPSLERVVMLRNDRIMAGDFEVP